jgi:hypothetical protein
MGKQKGGRIFYEATRVKTPAAIEGALREMPAPIPSQTGGQCSTDSIIVILFYADGLREALWDWLFRKFPGGKINLSDEELSPDVLVRDIRRMTSAFLVTIGARVLRILDTVEPRISDVRPRSFAPGEETHDTTPSEVCSNIGISLSRILKISKAPPTSAEPLRFIDPKSRSSAGDYGITGALKSDRQRIMEWVLRNFLYSEIDRSKFGTFSPAAGAVRMVGRSSEIVAMNIALAQIESEERPVEKEGADWEHSISVVRINDAWYVADNEVGRLIPMQTAAGGQFTPEMMTQLESPHEVYFELRYTQPPGAGAGYPQAQYFLKDLAGNVLASTERASMLAREPDPSVRPLLGENKIMREMYGIEVPAGVVVVLEPRTMIYWKRPTRITGPPTGWESIAAGAPAGPRGRVATVADLLKSMSGNGRTRKSKKAKRRKTKRASRASRGGRVRPSLPK